jgi:hypothetical protein
MFNSCEEPGVASQLATYGYQPGPASQSTDFATQNGRVTGIDLRSLPPGTELVVDTRYSRYRVVMLEGPDSNALVQGGRYFRQETEARINGSTCGGGLLKSGWIGLGLFVEILAGGKRITTSGVRSIRVEETHEPAGLAHRAPEGTATR